MPDPITTINNNGMYTILQEATNEILGSEAIDNISLQDIVQTGQSWDFTKKEQWVKALTARRIKTIYTDAAYSDKRNDVFFTDSSEFGAVLQVISMEMPDIIENRAWLDVQSGTTQIGVNTVYLPIVNEQLFAGTDSWGVSIAYTGTQLDAAFNSASELLQFDNYVNLMAENAIELHRATMNGLNRNNYMAEKINLATPANPTAKLHVINLVEEYQRDHANSAMTRKQFFSSPDAMRYTVKTFAKYKSMLKDMTTLFTSDDNSKGLFIPENRFVMQVLADFEGRMDAEVYSTTYHDEFVKLKGYRRVNAWQALVGALTADFETLSSIDVTTADGNTVNKDGIVALMCDKWAIMHTMVQRRVGYQRDDIKDISMYDYQFTDRYINNLRLNGIVFVVDDYTPSP